MTDAEKCRINGWVVGTRLTGDDDCVPEKQWSLAVRNWVLLP